ncbi:hypothetical protein GCM10027072_64040 [Streptomyces bullii]
MEGGGGCGLPRMGLHDMTVPVSKPPALLTVLLAFAVSTALLAGCVGPSWSETDYSEKVANTAEVARSAVQTARPVVEAADDGKAPGPHTATALSDAETALTSIATHIGAVQPAVHTIEAGTVEPPGWAVRMRSEAQGRPQGCPAPHSGHRGTAQEDTGDWPGTRPGGGRAATAGVAAALTASGAPGGTGQRGCHGAAAARGG